MQRTSDSRGPWRVALALVVCLGFLLGGYHAHEVEIVSASGEVPSGATKCPACILGQTPGAAIVASAVAEVRDHEIPLVAPNATVPEESPLRFAHDWRGPPATS